jgi:multisubunit Na+/H+ antiporter MnhC subunit
MTMPPTRPLGQTLVLSAAVIGIAALGAVVLWAATGWLWLVVHEGLH